MTYYRYPGYSPHYSRFETALYVSRKARLMRGFAMSPTRHNGNKYYFRSTRGPMKDMGNWIVTVNPDGGGGGGCDLPDPPPFELKAPDPNLGPDLSTSGVAPVAPPGFYRVVAAHSYGAWRSGGGDTLESGPNFFVGHLIPGRYAEVFPPKPSGNTRYPGSLILDFDDDDPTYQAWARENPQPQPGLNLSFYGNMGTQTFYRYSLQDPPYRDGTFTYDDIRPEFQGLYTPGFSSVLRDYTFYRPNSVVTWIDLPCASYTQAEAKAYGLSQLETYMSYSSVYPGGYAPEEIFFGMASGGGCSFVPTDYVPPTCPTEEQYTCTCPDYTAEEHPYWDARTRSLTRYRTWAGGNWAGIKTLGFPCKHIISVAYKRRDWPNLFEWAREASNDLPARELWQQARDSYLEYRDRYWAQRDRDAARAADRRRARHDQYQRDEWQRRLEPRRELQAQISGVYARIKELSEPMDWQYALTDAGKREAMQRDRERQELTGQLKDLTLQVEAFDAQLDRERANRALIDSGHTIKYGTPPPSASAGERMQAAIDQLAKVDDTARFIANEGAKYGWGSNVSGADPFAPPQYLE